MTDIRLPGINNLGKPAKAKSNRGFASMDPQRQREIAGMGGKAAHLKGTAYQFTSEKAREAGRLSHLNRGKK